MMKHRPWTPRELDTLRRDYPNTKTAAIVAELGRSYRAVYHQARQLGLRKSAAYMASPAACSLKRGANPGVPYRFKPGHVPHNKGRKFQAGGRSTATQFKPGNRPRTWRPIGSERIHKDGYLQRKTTDTGYAPRDWVGVHVLMWQQHHGPVPAGHIVVFINGDKRDLRIDNLAAISRAENMRRNSVQNLPEPLAQLCQLKGVLTRQINRLERSAGQTEQQKPN